MEAPVTPETAPVTPETAPVTPETAPVTPEATPVTPETAPVTPDQASESATAPPTTSKRARRWATIAMIAGIVGAIVSVALVGGVWVAKGVADQKIDAVATAVNEPISSGLTVTENVTARLTDVSASLAAASADAAALAANPAPTDAEVGSLRSKLTDIGARYDTFRGNYLELQANVLGALDGLNSIARLVPTIQPAADALSDAFNTLDGVFTKLDQAITNVRQAITDLTALPDTARSVAAGTLSGIATDAATKVQGVSDRLTGLQARIDQTHDDLSNYVLWAAIAGTVVAIWLFLVHLGLFAFARRVRNS